MFFNASLATLILYCPFITTTVLHWLLLFTVHFMSAAVHYCPLMSILFHSVVHLLSTTVLYWPLLSYINGTFLTSNNRWLFQVNAHTFCVQTNNQVKQTTKKSHTLYRKAQERHVMPAAAALIARMLLLVGLVGVVVGEGGRSRTYPATPLSAALSAHESCFGGLGLGGDCGEVLRG